MIKLTILKAHPERFLYGVSQIDNYKTVEVWQESNVVTIGLENTYYCFAKNKLTGKISRYVKYATCDTNCHMIIGELKLIKSVCKIIIGELKVVGNGTMPDLVISEQFTGTSNIQIQLQSPNIVGSIIDLKTRIINNISEGISCYSNGVLLKNNESFDSRNPFHISIDESLTTYSNFDYFTICSVTSIGNTNFAKVSGKLTKSTSGLVGLVISNNYQTGITDDSSYVIDDVNYWYSATTGEFWKQMSVSIVPNTYKILISVDLRGWGVGEGNLFFKVDIGPEWYTKAEIEAIDFTAMKGRTISIFGVLRNLTTNEIMDTKQVHVHFKGDYSTNLPSFFKQAPDRRIGSPSYFPNFSLPSSKLNINNYGPLSDNFENENYLYLSKGYNLITKKGNPLVPESKTMYSDYDRWLYYDSNGTRTTCPISDGSNNKQAQVVAWIASQTMPRLLQLFIPVIYGATGHAVIFYDAEAWGYEILNNQTALNKLATLYKEMKRINPTIKQTSYVNAKPVVCDFDANITQSQMLVENNKYNLTRNDVAMGLYAKTVNFLDLTTTVDTYTGESSNFGDLMGIGICGDYLHRYNDSSFYAFIQEMELGKKFFPNVTLLSLWWSYLETLPSSNKVDINTVRRYFRKTNGFWYFTDYKVAVPFSEFFNRIVAASFWIEGTWIWHDPNTSLNNFDYHGGNAKDVRQGTSLEPEVKWTDYPYLKDNVPNQFTDLVKVGQMEISSTLGHDWGLLGLYIASTSGDLIEENVLYTPFSLDNGQTFISGERLKPASCEYYKTPIVRIKKHKTLNYWLIFAHNKHLKAHEMQTITVLIESVNKTINITLRGKYSTLERVKLQ